MSAETTVRVVSYNIRTRDNDRSAVASVVRDLAPDILIAQEAPRRFGWRQRCAALAHSVGLVVAAGGSPGLGNLILTDLRVRVERTWCMRFPFTPGRHLRGAVFARCSVGGARFTVAGSHLATDPVERPAQAKLLREALAELDPPVVVGADLNDVPSSPAWQALADGLVDAGDPTPTHSCADPSRRIDAIFVDPRLEVASYRVLDTPEVRHASDHFPVVADLRLAP